MIEAKTKIDFEEKRLLQCVREAQKGKGGKDPLMMAGLLVEAEAKKSMREGGRFTGPRGGKQRIPSTPGKPPHVQTGNLRASITTAKDEKGKVIVGPTRMAWYGKIHEYGGEFGGRNYPARPFMRPALDAVKTKFPRFWKSLPLSRTPTGHALNAKKEKG